jgi:anti-sigma regulatory factor (Ser/Thr protein kinase)
MTARYNGIWRKTMLSNCNPSGLASTDPQEYTRMRTVVCAITREADVYVSMVRARELATALGFDQIERTRIEIAVLELTRNIPAHAVQGELWIEHVTQGDRQGLAISASDNGPGIGDVELALRDGFSTKQTLGAGLPGVRRLMDEFQIESHVGRGTRIRAIKWGASAARLAGVRRRS